MNFPGGAPEVVLLLIAMAMPGPRAFVRNIAILTLRCLASLRDGEFGRVFDAAERISTDLEKINDAENGATIKAAKERANHHTRNRSKEVINSRKALQDEIKNSETTEQAEALRRSSEELKEKEKAEKYDQLVNLAKALRLKGVNIKFVTEEEMRDSKGDQLNQEEY